jgi:hypothetical protein
MTDRWRTLAAGRRPGRDPLLAARNPLATPGPGGTPMIHLETPAPPAPDEPDQPDGDDSE